MSVYGRGKGGKIKDSKNIFALLYEYLLPSQEAETFISVAMTIMAAT
jgi:hypothetical protein